MIRIGCCTNMLADAVDRAGLSYIFKAAQAGFAYVEPPLAEFMNLEEETLLQVERLLKNDKIRVDAFCNLFPASLRLTGPEADLKKADGYMEQALQLAARFGASRVVFGSGAARWVPEGFSRKQAFEQLVILTEHMAKIAEKNGIVVAIEPLNRGECNIINTFREGCHLAERVNHPNIRVMADYYHFTLEQDCLEDLEHYGKQYLVHVHFAEVQGRSYPSRQRREYKSFIRALQKAGYGERISCEGHTRNLLTEGVHAVELLTAMWNETAKE